MLNGITWGEYLIAVLILLIIYYSYVGLRYYLPELKQKHLAKSTENSSDILIQDFAAESENNANGFQSQSAEDNSEGELDMVDDLILRIRGLLEKSTLDKFEENIREKLAEILKKYPVLKYSALRPSLNELILSEIEKLEIEGLSAVAEIDVLWDELQ